MTFEDWKKQNDMEVAILDQVIGLLVQFRDAAAISSYPGGLGDLGIRKKQPFDHLVVSKGAGSSTPMNWGAGMEDCGK
jgi:hypothetical protein